MKCPYSCGWEGSPEEYAKHYVNCPIRLSQEGKAAPTKKGVTAQLKMSSKDLENSMHVEQMCEIINAKVRENKYHIEEITEETNDYYYVLIAVWKKD